MRICLSKVHVHLAYMSRVCTLVFLTLSAQDLVCLCVCLCVCLSLATIALEATKQYRSDTNRISASSSLKIKCFFLETTEFKSYGMKTSEKANILISTGLPQLLFAQFRHRIGIRNFTMERQRVQRCFRHQL